MKKILLFCAAAAMVVSCGRQPGYRIDGNVSGLEDGKVYLSVFEGKIPQVIDSAEAVGGKFTFQGELKLPMLAQIASETTPVVPQFFIENSDITVGGALPDSVKVAGSAEQLLFEGYLASLDSLDYMTANKQFVASNPSSAAAAYVLFRRVSPYLEFNEMREMVAGFDTTLSNNLIYLQLVKDMADKLELTSPGHKFIDFSLPDTIGNVIALSDVAGKGQYVLLDFWASWCAPCRAENPHVVEAYKQFGDKGFTVFGVSLDKPGEAESWKKAIQKDNLTWTNVSDLKFWNSAPAATYGVRSIPSNLLIGPDGVIVARNLRGKGLTDKLQELLGDKK